MPLEKGSTIRHDDIMSLVKVIMIGDVVGEPGLRTLEDHLPALIEKHSVDFTVVNGENAADGFGMTEAAFRRIVAAGADVVTSGNHVWEKRDFLSVMNTEERMLRPANYPGAAGRGWIRIEKAARGEDIPVSWLVINLQGREFMSAIDCPFRCFDAASEHGAGSVILVDFHAESSREKESLGFYLDGRASLVAGTHTHVQTADERILPKGTAYVTDLGMTGIQNGIIGMDIKVCLDRARYQVLYRMEVAGGNGTEPPANSGAFQYAVRGVAADIESETGRAVAVRRI
jgi:metallophosphoesterase (TIGR00282 family)